MEIIAIPVQKIGLDKDVIFTDSVVDGCDIISHESGTEQIKLQALSNRAYTRFYVSFKGNIAVPTKGTTGEISIAIASDGKADLSTNAVVTPTETTAFFQVSASTYVYVRRGDCLKVSVKNTSNQNIEVKNANLIAVIR